MPAFDGGWGGWRGGGDELRAGDAGGLAAVGGDYSRTDAAVRGATVKLLARRRMTVTKIDEEWLKAFDEAMLGLFAIGHSDASMDEFLLGCYADLPPREAALAFGDDYDLDRDDALWPRPGWSVKTN